MSQSSDLAAIYRRVSTDHQDGSLEVQEKRVLDYLKFKNLQSDDALTFADPDTSGSIPILDRSGGRALIARLQFRDIKHIVIAKLDRLGRNTRDFLTTIETLDRLGVTLHIADFGGDSMSTQGHWGKMILTILAAVAEGELGEIRDRTRKRMRLKFEKGELTGKVPFGYDCRYTFADGSTLTTTQALSAVELAEHGSVVSKQLIENLAEQAIIRNIFAWRAHWSLKRIADHLNSLNCRPKLGGLWQCGNVHSILKSRHAAKALQSPAG